MGIITNYKKHTVQNMGKKANLYYTKVYTVFHLGQDMRKCVLYVNNKGAD